MSVQSTRTKTNTLRSAWKLGIATFALATACIGPAQAEDSARYMVLENCGVYTIDNVKLSTKGGSELESLAGWLNVKEAVCFDTALVRDNNLNELLKEGQILRIVATIGGAIGRDTRKCDSTRITREKHGDVRIFRMEGNLVRNNRCKSENYASTKNSRRGKLYSNNCGEHGHKIKGINCN